MAQRLNPLQIHVEGRNDQFALVNLLIRHGVNYDLKPWPDAFPVFSATVSDSADPAREDAGIDALLKVIPDQVKIHAARSVGFVVDADANCHQRWQEVRVKLKQVGVDTPDKPKEGGFIGESAMFKTRVGVWLMPDNGSVGALEHFLEKLVPPASPLYDFARNCTIASQKQPHDADFREVDQLKATLACWLAWQKNPGRPYGTGIRAGYFGKDSPEAHKFVAWFKDLFHIDSVCEAC